MFAEDDVTKNYHGGNKFSEDANRRVDKLTQGARIAVYISQQPNGATVHEVISGTGIAHQSASSRMSDMKRRGILREVLDERGEQIERDHCGVVEWVPDNERRPPRPKRKAHPMPTPATPQPGPATPQPNLFNLQ